MDGYSAYTDMAGASPWGDASSYAGVDASSMAGAGMGGAAAGLGGMLGPMAMMSGLSGVAGILGGSGLFGSSGDIQQQMDPFARYRGYYADQMMQLQRDPTRITSMPGYAAGLEGVQRSLGAQGYQGSGNMMAELQKYSGDFYLKQMAQLGQFAGAGATPGAGVPYAQQAQQTGMNYMGQGLASMGNAAMLYALM